MFRINSLVAWHPYLQNTSCLAVNDVTKLILTCDFPGHLESPFSAQRNSSVLHRDRLLSKDEQGGRVACAVCRESLSELLQLLFRHGFLCVGYIKEEVHGLTRACSSFGRAPTGPFSSLIYGKGWIKKKRCATLIISCQAPHLESISVLRKMRVNISNEAGEY